MVKWLITFNIGTIILILSLAVNSLPPTYILFQSTAPPNLACRHVLSHNTAPGSFLTNAVQFDYLATYNRIIGRARIPRANALQISA